MATTKKSDKSSEEVVADPHAEAYAERQKDARYDDPTIATPGELEDIDEEVTGPQALVDTEGDVGLDPSVDNRDQVQPMLDTLVADAEEKAEAAAQPAVAASATTRATEDKKSSST